MEFAIYSYVDLDHSQYVGLVQDGFDTIEKAILFKNEFKAGDWSNELLGTLFVSLKIEDDSINRCTEHFDRRWVTVDGVQTEELRDMNAEYTDLLMKYQPRGVMQKLQLMYNSFTRFVNEDSEVLRKKFSIYDTTSYMDCKLEVPYGISRDDVLRYKRYFLGSDSLSCNFGKNHLIMDSEYSDTDALRPEFIENSTITCIDKGNLVLEYKRTEVINPIVRVRTGHQDKTNGNIVYDADILVDISSEDTYFQMSVLHDIPDYERLVNLYKIVEYAHNNFLNLKQLSVNEYFLNSKVGVILV